MSHLLCQRLFLHSSNFHKISSYFTFFIHDDILLQYSQRIFTTTLEDGENEQEEVLGPDEQIQIQLERELELLELRREAGE